MSFLDKTGLMRLWTNIITLVDTRVPTTRTVNGRPLSTDITLSASDIGIDKILPTVTNSDNGKFLRVVNGTWVASSVPNAEEATF